MVITKLYCPFCGEEMNADIHTGPHNEYEEGTCYYDNWICNSDDSNTLICKVAKETIVFGRDEIEVWLK